MSVKWLGETSSNNSSDWVTAAKYIHSGNPSVKPISVDITTGIFTAQDPLPMSPGSTIVVTVNYLDGYPSALFSEWNGTYHYYLYAIDSTTFYVQDDSTGVYANFTSYSKTIDLTNIVFEYNTPSINIDLTGIPNLLDYTKFKVRLQSTSDRAGWRYTYLNYLKADGTSDKFSSGPMVDGRQFMEYFLEFTGIYIKEKKLALTLCGDQVTMQWSGGTSWQYAKSTNAGRTFDKSDITQLTSITGPNLTNGAMVELLVSK